MDKGKPHRKVLTTYRKPYSDDVQMRPLCTLYIKHEVLVSHKRSVAHGFCQTKILQSQHLRIMLILY